MKNKVSLNDLLVLISWVKVYQFFELRRFDYQKIFDNVENLYKNGAEYFDVSGSNIDDLMIDAYKLYIKISKSRMILDKLDDNFKFPYFDKKMLIEESQKFEKVIEYMLTNIKYEKPEILDIQKVYLTDKMYECAQSENYEEAAIYRDLIEECKI